MGTWVLDSSTVAFIVAAALLTLTPGADTMLVLKNVMRSGRRHGLQTTVGICSGLFVHASLSALGLSAIVAGSAVAFGLLKILGAVYLGWLGLAAIWRAIRPNVESMAISGKRRFGTRWLASPWTEGLLTNVLNPKVVVFYLAFLPQFIDPTDPVLPKSLLLAATHVVMGLLWLGGLTLAIDQAQHLLGSAKWRRLIDGLSGTVLAGLGIRLLLER